MTALSSSSASFDPAQLLNFSQDSPLFAKKVQSYETDFHKLQDYLRVLARLMGEYCTNIRNAAKSCEAFHIHMRQGLNHSSHHTVLNEMMRDLGDVFGEIAHSQEILAESLSCGFVGCIEKFGTVDLARTNLLQEEYKKERATLNASTVRYLQGDVTNTFGGKGSGNLTSDLRALEVVQQRRTFELTRFDMVNRINEMERQKNFEIAEACVASLIALRTHHNFCAEKLISAEKYTNDLNKRQQEERAELEVMKNKNASKRSDLDAVLSVMIERVENQLPAELFEDDSGVGASSDGGSSGRGGSFVMGGEGIGGGTPITSSSSAFTSEEARRRHDSSGKYNKNAGGSTMSRFGAFGAFGANLIGGFTGVSSTTAAPKPKMARSRSTSPMPMKRRDAGSPVHGVGVVDKQPVGAKFSAATSAVHAAALAAEEARMMCGKGDVDLSELPLEEVEIRMKALDRSELENLFESNELEEFAGVVHHVRNLSIHTDVPQMIRCDACMRTFFPALYSASSHCTIPSSKPFIQSL
jgi:hypothetical protein